MKQTTLSVMLEVQPESADKLTRLIDALKHEEETVSAEYPEQYDRLKKRVPALHFMSLCVFPSADYDPIFVIEANFDGAPGAFWSQLEAILGNELRDMLRCCKEPLDEDGPLYRAVVAPGSSQPLARYLQARTLRPSAFHHGNRGLDRDRILNEGELFRATRVALAQPDPAIPNPYRAMTAQQIHAALRAALLPGFPWLDKVAPARISPAERAGDALRLAGFLCFVLAGLSVPGIVAALILPWPAFFVLFAVAIALVYLFLYRMHAARPGEGVPTRSGGLTPKSLSSMNELSSLKNPKTLGAVVTLFLVLYIVFAATLGAVVASPIVDPSFGSLWWPSFRVVVAGLASGLLFTIPAVGLWLRRLERRDSSHDAPPTSDLIHEMAKHEDRIAQNHMGSVVLVKPGMLRMALFHTGHVGLGLILRVVATDGYLGTMRTIHFAHWAFVNNGSRLMFFSNFDHSWESYLDDFIEKAHGGLTLAWSSGVGFPPTRFLVLDGASHGRKFKAWARHSMTVSRFWYSAYKSYTVNQIERHARIADGLRKAALTPKEAAEWARDL